MHWIANLADMQSACVACSASMTAFVSTLLCQCKESKRLVPNDHTTHIYLQYAYCAQYAFFSLCISISDILEDTYMNRISLLNKAHFKSA